ncbi:MAG TPA: hypothetical protein VEZ14_11615 [Dehalococcoidia bacterium]|nr:hypothetical protein [Dehalococcoidia bacterium]
MDLIAAFASLPMPPLPVLSIVGTIGVLGAALALGFRHGIDWDHIAAITDITSTTAGSVDRDERWLTGEPGVMLTDESHHALVHQVTLTPVTVGAPIASAHAHDHMHGPAAAPPPGGIERFVRRQKPSMLLATMYALGHGSVVFLLGLAAVLARQFLPAWIDPIMERIVGVTLLLLAAYLFFSVFQYFRSGEEFRLRSRWMLVFAWARNAFEGARSRVLGTPRQHVHEARQYGFKTAYGIGMIHGIGAETGTQVLVITTAVGAGSKAAGIVALSMFVVGLLISNTVVALITTVGFVSARQRQTIYVAAGLFAAVFSLFVGSYFVLQSAHALPNLDQYFHWVGGGSAR